MEHRQFYHILTRFLQDYFQLIRDYLFQRFQIQRILIYRNFEDFFNHVLIAIRHASLETTLSYVNSRK